MDTPNATDHGSRHHRFPTPPDGTDITICSCGWFQHTNYRGVRALTKLGTLNLAYSTLTDPRNVALYLVNRILEDAGIGLPWKYRPTNEAPLKEAYAKWKEVASVLDLLYSHGESLNRRFKSEMRRLQRENEALRTQLEERLVGPILSTGLQSRR